MRAEQDYPVVHNIAREDITCRNLNIAKSSALGEF